MSFLPAARPISSLLWRIAVRILATVGLLFVLITFSPFVSWYATRLSRPWANERGEVLVVLSASGPNAGVMDPSTYWRCFMALLFYREHPYRQIIVTGIDAAPGMRDFLVFNGVPADRIRMEDKATNTHENAAFTAPMLSAAKGRIVLLTSESHMFRAQRCFAKSGVSVSPVPVPDVVKRAANYSERLPLFIGEIRETAGIVYYWYRGWI
jgi:uncharacterized SAM-binding protein YcdF (DUF218 family)